MSRDGYYEVTNLRSSEWQCSLPTVTLLGRSMAEAMEEFAFAWSMLLGECVVLIVGCVAVSGYACRYG